LTERPARSRTASRAGTPAIHDGIAIDDRVRAIGTTHDLLGRVERVTSYADTAATTALNEVEFAYDGLWQVTSVTQQHDGPVDINSPAVGIAHDIQPVASGNRSRRTVLTYPDGWELETTYGSSGSVDDLISRTRDLRDAATDAVYAQYDWIGIGTPAIVGYGIPQVSLSRFVAHNGTTTTGQYPGLDRYGRIARQHWSTAAFGPHATNTAVPNRPPIVETAYLYDNASSRTGAFDARPGSAQPLSQSYSYDGLHRLTEATRGIWNGSLTTPSVSQLRDSQAWSLDPLGNWSSVATAATNAGIDDPDDIEIRDYRDAPGGDPENRVNQLMSRTLSASAGGDEPALTYDFAGNILRQELTNDGTDTTALRYTHDAWNRLVKVQFEDDEEDLHPRGEYEYNGLNWRTVARIDTDTTDTTHALDEERFLYYSPEWQVLEARVDSDRQSSPGIDRHIQHVWGVRYIDDIVSTRQDYDPSEENGAELITFHVTDAQFSTVAIVDADATVIERITYTAYGVARHHWRADIDGDGAVGGADLGLVFSAWGTSIGDAGYLAEADLNLDGTIGGADSGLVLAGYQSALAPGVLSSPLVDNRIGYCGYLFAPETQSYLVRFRWYLPPLGRWGVKDPIGYFDGMNRFQYVQSSPIPATDPLGLAKCISAEVALSQGHWPGWSMPKAKKLRFGVAGVEFAGELAVTASGQICLKRCDPCSSREEYAGTIAVGIKGSAKGTAFFGWGVPVGPVKAVVGFEISGSGYGWAGAELTFDYCTGQFEGGVLEGRFGGELVAGGAAYARFWNFKLFEARVMGGGYFECDFYPIANCCVGIKVYFEACFWNRCYTIDLFDWNNCK
jgi:RHS repeat-associated protein